jgi:hypothetical protein
MRKRDKNIADCFDAPHSVFSYFSQSAEQRQIPTPKTPSESRHHPKAQTSRNPHGGESLPIRKDLRRKNRLNPSEALQTI